MSENIAGQMASQAGSQAAGTAQSTASSAAGSGMSKATGKRIFWYCLVSLIISAGCGASALICEDHFQLYLTLTQVIFFVFGIVHVALMYSLFPWAGKYNFKSEILFTMLTMFLMYLGYTVTFYFLNKNFAFLYSASVITFILPLLIQWAFNFTIAIPPKAYKKWYFPDKPIVTDIENMDLSNFAVITFIFSKKFGDKTLSNFQSKAPYSIRLGDLFYFFVQEWNYKNPGSTIEYMAGENIPFGWHFCVKKSWWQPKKYLDADITVKENNITVNAVITTERVPLQKPN